MSVISKRFADELTEKKMRDAYLSAQTRTKLTNQIRTIRSQRGWSQGQFAKILEKPQSNVSRLENREYGSFTLSTLFDLASAFDIGLVVEFVPYDDFLRRTHDLTLSHLRVRSFSRSDLEPLCRDVVAGSSPAT
jgi:transcriptional regulator with XRE-family HTH domain